MPELDCAIPDLGRELEALLSQIPPGRVTTYGDLAEALGTRAAARWVGEYLRDHEHSATCDCHRVVRKGGELGLYARSRDPAEKAERLCAEGVPVRDHRVHRFEAQHFSDFRSSRSLARLLEYQERIARRVQLNPIDGLPPIVAGLDVSYCSDGLGVGACAVVDTNTCELLWSTTVLRPAGLPYIPSLLAFRELPLHLALFDETQSRWPDLHLYLVDGNGILHPRGAGVATCFGVAADVPTIGVAKSLLCGRIESKSASSGSYDWVSVEGKIVASAVKWGRSVHPLYVSPGQKIDVEGASRVIAALHRGHRLPEPLYLADHLSRAAARQRR